MITPTLLTPVQEAALADHIKWNADGRKFFRAVCIVDTGAWTDEPVGYFETAAEALACIQEFADLTDIVAIINIRETAVPFADYMIEDD
jgi:hypothetical protein